MHFITLVLLKTAMPFPKTKLSSLNMFNALLKIMRLEARPDS